jgi:hypothetical protein
MEVVMAGISDKAYKELQQILEKQYRQTFAIEEVKEIGDGLVEFVSILKNIHDHMNNTDKNEGNLE